MSYSSPRAVAIMTGTERVSAEKRMRLRISSPSSPGSMTSRMMSSGTRFAIASKSCSPFSSPSASNPVERRA